MVTNKLSRTQILVDQDYQEDVDRFQLKCFVYYDKRINKRPEEFIYYISNRENYEKYLNEIKKSSNVLNINTEIINNWYPKNLLEKIDKMLLCAYSMSKYEGDIIEISKSDLKLLIFSSTDAEADKVFKQQYEYVFNYLKDLGYIKIICNRVLTAQFDQIVPEENFNITLLPNGLERVYELQKYQVNNKDVFIAMSFKDELKSVMDVIKKAITDSGYIPLPICDVPHNNWIMPEIFHAIRNSKFVVVDLTTHNLGAYYESGYAEGLGKQVIHTCRSDDFINSTHFDVKQKVTIDWKTEEDLYKRLKARIEATIGN